MLFDELLSLANLRAKSYVVHEVHNGGLACVELTARRLEDWFFARRWIATRNGRRLLFWLLDEVESQGFRFRVTRGGTQPEPAQEPWVRAAEQWRTLEPDERQVHRDLFPQEERLLEEGYDWDHAYVYRGGEPLAADEVGRVLEETNGMVYEWVRVADEFTWRRFPLYASIRSSLVGPGATGAADAIRGT